MPPRAARVRVPCSTSNLGAGFDCIGLAFDRHITATFTTSDAGELRVSLHGTAQQAGSRNALLDAFNARIRESSQRVSGELRIESNIPVARGLGSSAAATVAGFALANAVLGSALARGELLERATSLEGHPDNAAPALFGGLVGVARDRDGALHAMQLTLSPQVGFAYAAPDAEVRTPEARRALPKTVEHALAVRSIGRTAALLQGLATADAELLRVGFTDELHVPYRLPLIPGAEAATEAARAAGAWAVTISGSGSGMIAVGPPDRGPAIARAMAQAFGQSDPNCAFAATPDLQGTVVDYEV